MKKLLCFICLFSLLGCTKEEGSYTRVLPTEAQVMMEESVEPFVLVDVRRIDEYSESHIEGAINIPLDTIDESVYEILKDKNQAIYIYCRSGNRSQEASQKLVDLGYTNIIEMGGIIDWEGSIVE